MQAGRLDRRARFFRRATIANTAGNRRGDYATTPFYEAPAQLRQLTGTKIVEGGLIEDALPAVLRIRDCIAARLVTNADRVSLEAAAAAGEFEIVSVGLAERRGGFIELVIRRRMGGG